MEESLAVRTRASRLARATVLLAEDDDELRDLLAKYLRRHGTTVIECRNGVELVEQLDSAFGLGGHHDVDAVVTDIRMPGISGLDVLDTVYPSSKPYPVIVVTAFGDEQAYAEARRLGAYTILNKPFAPHAIVDELERALHPNRRGGQ